MSVSYGAGGGPSSPRVSVGLGSCSTRALAVVTNKWYREQRRAEQDVTRSLTILKQRKISCILKVSSPFLRTYLFFIREVINIKYTLNGNFFKRGVQTLSAAKIFV